MADARRWNPLLPTGEIDDARYGDPMRWRKSYTVAVAADLFAAEVTDTTIAKVVGLMGAAHDHQFAVLTQHSGRADDLIGSDAFRELVFKSCSVGVPDVMGDYWPLPNLTITAY